MKSLRDEIRLDGGWVDGFNFIVSAVNDFNRAREDFTISEANDFIKFISLLAPSAIYVYENFINPSCGRINPSSRMKLLRKRR